MTTKEAVRAVRSECGLARTAVVMAVATIIERFRSLPKADQNDFYALAKEVPSALDNPEDLESIMAGMVEILEQEPVQLKCIDQTEESPFGIGLQRWLDWVSERIRTARKQANLTQEALAEKSGLPQSHISRLESGKHSPSRTTLTKIAAALGVEVGFFDPSA